jgi:hypothetical protein
MPKSGGASALEELPKRARHPDQRRYLGETVEMLRGESARPLERAHAH